MLYFYRRITNICGYRNSEVKDMSVREWTYQNCHTGKMDRDINPLEIKCNSQYYIYRID